MEPPARTVPEVAVAANHPQALRLHSALAAPVALATRPHGRPAQLLSTQVAVAVGQASREPQVPVVAAAVVPVVPVVQAQPHQPQEAPTAQAVAALA